MDVTARRILKNFTPQKMSPARLLRKFIPANEASGDPVIEVPCRPLSFPAAKTPSAPSPYPFFVDSNNLLEELGRKYLPTKRDHNYLPLYWMHFRDIRLKVRKVCEIGLQRDASLRMWEEFFPNAEICGIDIDPACREFEGGRRRVFIGDQSDRRFLGNFLDEVGGGLDIVIDDGSHLVDHQLATFEILLPALNRHGIYVMEDTGPCVGDYQRITVNSLQQLAANVLYWPEGYRPEDWPKLSSFPDTSSWADRNVVGVAVYRWIAFVFRGDNPGDNPYLKRDS
jgi:hypothetical protein